VTNDVLHQPIPRLVVEHVTYERAGLAPVVVVEAIMKLRAARPEAG
jgi:hypothetical protein